MDRMYLEIKSNEDKIFSEILSTQTSSTAQEILDRYQLDLTKTQKGPYWFILQVNPKGEHKYPSRESIDSTARSIERLGYNMIKREDEPGSFVITPQKSRPIIGGYDAETNQFYFSVIYYDPNRTDVQRLNEAPEIDPNFIKSLANLCGLNVDEIPEINRNAKNEIEKIVAGFE